MSSFNFPPLPSSWRLISSREALTLLAPSPSPLPSPSYLPTPSSASLSNPLLETLCDLLSQGTNSALSLSKSQGLLPPEVGLTCKAEIEVFLAMLLFMQDYNFLDYRQHFEPRSTNTLIKSPLRRLMSQTRFQTLLSSLALPEAGLPDLLACFNEVPTRPGLFRLQIKAFEAESVLFLTMDQEVLRARLQTSGTSLLEAIIQLLQGLEAYCTGILLPKSLVSIHLVTELKNKGLPAYGEPGDPLDIKMINSWLGEPVPLSKKERFLHHQGLDLMLIVPRNADKTLLMSRPVPEGCFQDLRPETGVYRLLKERLFSNTGVKWRFNSWKRMGEQGKPGLPLWLFKRVVLNWYIQGFRSFYGFLEFREQLFLHLSRQETEKIARKKTVLSRKKPKKIRKINENGHFPQKMGSCKVCRVCKDDAKPKKTKYRCRACSEFLGKDIALCVEHCFRFYHMGDWEKKGK